MGKPAQQLTRKRQRTRRDVGTQPYAGPPPGVPIDLALRRYGPPKLVAELAKLEAAAHSKDGASVDWHSVADCRERIWHALCGEVEQSRYCISHLPLQPAGSRGHARLGTAGTRDQAGATGARIIFPSDRCWYLRLPRDIPLPNWLGFHRPGPDTLDYLGEELRGVLIHQAPAWEVATHIWLIGQKVPPTAKATYAWAKARGYSQPAAWEIVTVVYGSRRPGRRPKPP
jgi:hypothetical protein